MNTVSLNLLLVNYLENLVCSASECLCWIIVLFDILTVFYLVFCAYFKVTKVVRIFGWVWASALMCSVILILFLHTCIFTILCAVFSAMIIMAVLSIIFENHKKNETTESVKIQKAKGSYVIHKTFAGQYSVVLYDKFRNFIVQSNYDYLDVEQAKLMISFCRENATNALLEDRTQNWIKETVEPKFIMFKEDEKYYFKFLINKNLVLFHSIGYEDIESCTKMLNNAMSAAKSTDIYLSIDSIKGSGLLEEDKQSPIENLIQEEIVFSSNHLVTKKSISIKMSSLFHNEIEIVAHDNYTKTGLPLADNYYTNGKSGKICFAYVYEVDGGKVTLLIRINSVYAIEIAKKHKILSSHFPKYGEWYKIIIDDSFANPDEIYEIMKQTKKYCENL